MSYGLTRRSLMRGLAGVACALPGLELFRSAGRAQAETPKRFVMMYAGMSPSKSSSGNFLVPDNLGAGYDLPRGLLSLGAGALPYGGMGYDVQNDVSIVSGLEIPWSRGNDIPPGGKSAEFHYNTSDPLTTGVRGGPERRSGPAATSADILVADTIGTTTPHRSLSYRVQAARYLQGNNASGGGLMALSRRRLEDGSLQRIDAIASPRLAYQSLFSGFVPDDSGRDAAIQRLRTRRDILSAVRARTSSVMPRLGSEDRRRLEAHFDELNSLEGRLAAIPEPGMGMCTVPTTPGDDPPIADGHAPDGGGSYDYTEGRAWSDEDLRGETMVDMVSMAFACDLTRSAGFRISLDQTFMSGGPSVGTPAAMHETTHGGGTENGCADSVGWHVGFFSRLVRRLRDTPEGDGSLLDNTAVVLLFEGGHGYDPEGDRNASPHSTENMAALVAGGAGGLRSGVHIQTDRVHPARVLASAMQGVGLEDRLGEIEGRIPELFD